MMWDKIKQYLFRPKISFPDWYQSYIAGYTQPSSKDNWEELSFVILDTETTGLDWVQDEIISIGAVRLQNNEIPLNNIFTARILRISGQNPGAATIHGLVQSDTKGRPAEEVIPAFFSYIGSAIIIGHHIGFDLKMIEKTSFQLGGGKVINHVLDTSTLAKRLDSPTDPDSLDGRQYSLDVLCKRFDITTKERHTALGDAYLTALLFLKLMHALEKKGIKTLGQLSK